MQSSLIVALMSRRRGAHICSAGPVWTARNASTSRNWQAIAYGSTRFVAGGGILNGAAMFSINNGVSWIDASIPPVFAGALPITAQCLKFGASTFVCANGGFSNNCATSPDGDVWTSGITIPVTGSSVVSLFYDGTNFIALCAGDNHCFTSPTGVVWTSRIMPSSDSWQVCGTNGIITIALAQSGATAISSDNGVTWVAGAALPAGISIYCSVSYGNGVFVAAPLAAGTQLFKSSNPAVSWSLSNVAPGGLQTYTDAQFLQGLFIVVNQGGQNVIKGTDGINYAASGLLPINAGAIWSFAGDKLGHYAAVGSISSGTLITASGIC